NALAPSYRLLRFIDLILYKNNIHLHLWESRCKASHTPAQRMTLAHTEMVYDILQQATVDVDLSAGLTHHALPSVEEMDPLINNAMRNKAWQTLWHSFYQKSYAHSKRAKTKPRTGFSLLKGAMRFYGMPIHKDRSQQYKFNIDHILRHLALAS